MARGRKGSVNVEALKHQDKRTNIPTEELRDFVAEDEEAPGTLLYPRDPSLDPQLVWKGKDEQDAADLAVPVVPIYIQEKVHPRAIIENVRMAASAEADQPEQLALFSDFNGIEFEQLVEFYQHEQHWTNRFILGDSLLGMTSLAEKERLRGQVQMIYFDPPYGIKFGSNWQVSTRRRNVRDGRAEDATRQPEQVRAYRDTWKDGINTYLAYLRDRLVVARELLTDSGSIFVQIGMENVHLVRCVLDEVFGSENCVSQITFATTSGFQSNELARGGDYILWYGKDREKGVKPRPLYEEISKEPGDGGYRWVMFEDGTYRGLTAAELRGEEPFPTGVRLYKPDNILSQGAASEDQTYHFRGERYSPSANSHWKASYPVGMDRLAVANRLHVASNSLQYIRYSDDFSFKARNNIWTDTLTGQFTDEKLYVVQTNTKVIERCMLMTTDPGDLVLDPTCGSGTTAYVAEQWGRRWITIDTSRVALALARTRLMSARFPYYVLKDSTEGLALEAEIAGAAPTVPSPKTGGDVRKGFVYRRAPHITLGSIANNEGIDAIAGKWDETMAPVLAGLNEVLGVKWPEWDVAREAEESWPLKAKELHASWWEMQRERQAEIDVCIARGADPATLVDQPYEDGVVLRVTGPFTVESLAPHRVLSAEAEGASGGGQSDDDQGQFVRMILDNLRVAGVQNTVKGERLKFDRLEPFAGEGWLHASGEYTENGVSKRVAVSIGPEHGTVGPEQIKEAAKEAVQGIGHDLLVVCGFAFDPHVSEEARRYGKLTVLVARMNPDLSMGDELLKKTGAGNLFMVFGEPDIELRKGADGRMVVELRGVDVYDPTTGEIRSSSTDDIACWFIDTDYNGESFFVRHAYFAGAGDPYEQLRRALRAEVNEDAWETLYSTVSYPFEAPSGGRIAVKVINHYGDEVLKVYQV